MLSEKAQVLRQLPWAILIVGIAGYIGTRLEAHEDERMSKFRDKSALYGRQLKPGERPSWP